MIRIHLRNGDRHVELTWEAHAIPTEDVEATARKLWAIVIAAGGPDPEPDPPRVEAGGFGFTAGELSPHLPDHTRPPLDAPGPAEDQCDGHCSGQWRDPACTWHGLPNDARPVLRIPPLACDPITGPTSHGIDMGEPT